MRDASAGWALASVADTSICQYAKRRTSVKTYSIDVRSFYSAHALRNWKQKWNREVCLLKVKDLYYSSPTLFYHSL